MKRLLSGWMVAVAIYSAVPLATAATFSVTKTTDTADGQCNADCSLREAIIAANATAESDTIALSPGNYLLTIAGQGENAAKTGDLDITNGVEIQGSGPEKSVINGNQLDRVFHVQNNAAVVLNNLIIKNGNPGASIGGGILIGFGQATVKNSVVSGNSASKGGSGIAVAGSLVVEQSAIRDNKDGGLYIAGSNSTLTVAKSAIIGNVGYGVNTAGIATITSSTIGNNAGYGITNTATGTLTLAFTTVAGNNMGVINNGTASVGASILVGNTPFPSALDCSGSFTSKTFDGSNRIGVATGCTGFFPPETGFIAADVLGPFVDPPTGLPYFPLKTGSLAINNGKKDPLHTDQLGQACILYCDMGAVESVCGNAQIDEASGEQCDDGNGNAMDSCLRTCVSATCGDWIVQTDVEECDNGPGNSDTDPGSCRTNCKEASCGDGVMDPSEACDDGNTEEADGCTNSCHLPATCGDGVLQEGETCDDGNANDTDACTTLCKPATCGDGFVQTNEACDMGAKNSNAGTCLPTCKKAACGDGFVLFGVEECDGGSGCDSACKKIAASAPPPVIGDTTTPPTTTGVSTTDTTSNGTTPAPTTGASGGCSLIIIN